MYSCLFVRKRSDLTNALDITPAYLRNAYSETGSVIDYRNWTISLGRRFRALKIWFVMRSYGLSGLKAHVRRTIALGCSFADLVRSRPDLFAILTTPAFCLTVLKVHACGGRALADGSDGDDTAAATAKRAAAASDNEVTKQVYELVNARGEIFITSTVLAGHYAIRVVSANPAAEEKYVRNAFDILVRTAEEVRQQQQQQHQQHP